MRLSPARVLENSVGACFLNIGGDDRREAQGRPMQLFALVLRRPRVDLCWAATWVWRLVRWICIRLCLPMAAFRRLARKGMTWGAVSRNFEAIRVGGVGLAFSIFSAAADQPSSSKFAHLGLSLARISSVRQGLICWRGVPLTASCRILDH